MSPSAELTGVPSGSGRRDFHLEDALPAAIELLAESGLELDSAAPSAGPPATTTATPPLK